MSDREILDAPYQEEEKRLRFSSMSVLWTTVALFLGFSTLFWLAKIDALSDLPRYRILYFHFDAIVILMIAVISFSLYFLVARLNFKAKDWYRIMVVCVTIVFFSLTAASVVMAGERMLANPVDSLKFIAFISLLAGGGCSLAVQLLRRKQYAFFLVAMILTLALFALGQYI